MRSCCIAIIGLGLMGSSSLYFAWGAAVVADVLASILSWSAKSARASHGSLPVYRRFNLESERLHRTQRAALGLAGAGVLFGRPF